MDEQRFKREMAKAQAFRKIGENPDYWRGFIRGLRRRYHGEDLVQPKNIEHGWP